MSAPVFTVTSSEVVPLTREMAERHLAMDASPTERILDPKRVKYLKDKLKENLFICPSWAIAKMNGKQLRMNGNHSAHAVREFFHESDGNLPDDLKAFVATYQVTTENELALLFRQFDARQSGRTAIDVSGAYQGLVAQLRDLPRKSSNWAAKGICWYRRELVAQNAAERAAVLTGDDVGQLFRESDTHEFIRWMAGFLTSKNPELRYPAVVAAMYGCWLARPHNAKEFWEEVSSGGGDDAVSSVLDEILRSSHESPSHKKLKARQLYGVCARGWNAYREDRKPSSLKQPDKKDLPTILP